MPKGVFDVSVLGIRTSRFSTTLNSVEHLKTVEIDSHGHQPLKALGQSRTWINSSIRYIKVHTLIMLLIKSKEA